MNLPYTLERSDLAWLAAAVAVLLISLYDANVALGLSGFGVVAAIHRFFHRVRDPKRRSPVGRVVVYGSCILLVVSGPAGCILSSCQTETAMQPVIAAIAKYHDAHGKYPENLRLLAVPIPHCPDPFFKAVYVRLDPKDEFVLGCTTYAFNHHVYESDSKQWYDQD